jgi:S-adenosylmethionine synthetase
VLVMGEITTSTYVDMNALVRDVVWDIGYTRAKFGFDGETCGVIVSIKEQSADIALGVDKALEAKQGEMTEEEIEAIGAGDQGMMVGFACTETPELMPMPIMMAHKHVLPYLRPDGKSQVTVEYEYGKPKRVDTIVISAQHSPDVSQSKIRDDLIHRVIKYVVPNGMLDENTKIYINPTGRFVTGGPKGDAGVTGRKIIVDTYGGMASHGGGAFSGKDPTKVDRSGAY